MIEVRGVTKLYGGRAVVNNVSFTIEAGKVTGFLGPNGAGKSTTMRSMLGLDKSSGVILYDGRPLGSYHPASQVVGILLDAKSFHPARTARNHLRTLARAGGIPFSRVDEVLALVGLQDVANKKPGKFSLGMSQRLGVAAAILGSPRYLILDEPSNGLDPEGMHWLRDFLRSYAAAGNSVFVSSHLLGEIQLMADNLVVIGQGSIMATGTVQDFIASAGSGGVYVRTTDFQKLAQALAEKGLAYTTERQGIRISGANPEQVGSILASLGLPVLELTSEQVSLEDVFLRMTSGVQEYRAGAQPPQAPTGGGL